VYWNFPSFARECQAKRGLSPGGKGEEEPLGLRRMEKKKKKTNRFSPRRRKEKIRVLHHPLMGNPESPYASEGKKGKKGKKGKNRDKKREKAKGSHCTGKHPDQFFMSLPSERGSRDINPARKRKGNSKPK